MKKYSILEGKNKFSHVVASAAAGEPQIITKNGQDTAVVISIEEYRRLGSKGQSLVEFMLDNPFRKFGIELDLTRDTDVGGKELIFDEEEED